MTVAFVQGAATDANASPISKAFPSNNTAGNLLVVGFAAGGASAPSISDTQGNTYTKVTSASLADNTTITLYYAPNCKAGANTVTVSTADSFLGLNIAEYSGVATASPLDGTLFGGTTGSSSTIAGSSYTPTSGDLAVAAMVNEGNVSQTPTTGWADGPTHQLNDATGANQDNAQEYQAAPGTAITAGWTLGGSANWAIVWAAFKPAASGTAFNRSSSWSLTPTVTVARSLTLGRALSWSLTPSVTVSRLYGAVRGLSWSVTPVVSLARSQAVGRALSWTLAPVVTVARLVTLGRSLSWSQVPSTVVSNGLTGLASAWRMLLGVGR